MTSIFYLQKKGIYEGRTRFTIHVMRNMVRNLFSSCFFSIVSQTKYHMIVPLLKRSTLFPPSRGTVFSFEKYNDAVR